MLKYISAFTTGLLVTFGMFVYQQTEANATSVQAAHSVQEFSVAQANNSAIAQQFGYRGSGRLSPAEF